MTRTLYQVPYFELTLRPETLVATSRVSRRKETKCQCWSLEKQKINVAGQGQPTHFKRMASTMLKTQRIGSEKTYGPKI